MIRFIKFLLRGLLRLLYRVEVEGLEHYQEAGNRVLIIANHTSLLDGVLLFAWLPDTPTFAINTDIAAKKSFRFYLKFVDLFTMDPTNPLSIKSMIKYLKRDCKAVIFPEGRITKTGSLMKVYEGPGLVADKAGATLLPVAIDGAQFSPFSYMHGRGRVIWFPRIKITVLPHEKISVPDNIQGHERRKMVALQLQDLMYKLTYCSFNYRTTIFDALLHAANRYGQKLTIVNDINRVPLNYRQLITRSIILGDVIRHDSSADENIGVLMPNVASTVVLIFALLRLGRVTAMLNFSTGIKAILLACETAQIKTIYTSRKFIENAKLTDLAGELEQKLNLVYLEDLASRVSFINKIIGVIKSYLALSSHTNKSGKDKADKPAVILFTSGSEGIPKGVVLSHSNILSNYAQVSCHVDFQPTDVVFSCLPLFHSFGLNAGCFMPLFGGSKIFLYPTPLHYRIIPELVYEVGATILFGTNTFFKGYARHAHPYDFYSIRYAVAGAEKLREDTLQLWMNKFGIRILQGYGVTETSPVISVNTPMQSKIGTTGRPLSGMEYYIQPVEGIDLGGRLVVKGPNVMLGYLLHGQPGKIQPPATDRGPGWYDTGDIATTNEQGYITILGRAKRFAKIGGEMVSLTAIEETAMKIWPEYTHAAVNIPDEKKGEKIILITNNKEADRKQFQEYARNNKIGELYIPKKIILTEDFPLLGSGKTDYMTLTQQTLDAEESGSGWLAKLSHLVKKHEVSESEKQDEDNISEEITIWKEH